MGSHSFVFLRILIMFLVVTTGLSVGLSPIFYNKVCPQALPTIKRLIQEAVRQEKRMGASLLRLHFHDCFVNGCDGSVLLDPTSTIDSEKNAAPNANSARGFEVIDRIKAEVDKVCRRPVVSCADILTLAARDSVVALGGPSWTVELGRRDSTTASRTAANSNLPSPFLDLPGLINAFARQGLGLKDLVALSGGHVIGFSQCQFFRNRIYSNATNIDPVFARQRQATCPRTGGNSNLAPLDQTANAFDTMYFSNLVRRRGLLVSDQALFSGGVADEFVKKYSTNPAAFFKDFGDSMIKMGRIKPLTGKNGQIRVNCRRVN